MSGSLPMMVQWYKDDTEIHSCEKYKCAFFENVAFLEIGRLSGADSGSYTCVAGNEAGSAHCSGTLTVKGLIFISIFICSTSQTRAAHVIIEVSVFPPTEPPHVLEKPESMNAVPGSKVRFSLRVSGTPPLTIKWFRNKKEILPSADCLLITDGASSSLELFFAKTSDSGEYVCEIQNAVGSTSCKASLFVKGNHESLIFIMLLHFANGFHL